jgi:ppGpp synthetase/RelA/SpoT-type nucleotidyltranferase
LTVTLTAHDAYRRYRQERPRIEEAAELTAAYIRRRAARRHLSCQVTCRAKEVSSFIKKAYRKTEYTDPWKQITDKAGIRLVVPYSSLLDEALDLVTGDGFTCIRVEDDREKPGSEDRLEYPRLHVQIRAHGEWLDPDGAPYECEVQIRTEAADVWARMSHSLMYKPGATTDIPSDVRRSLYRLIALVELYDSEVERGATALAEHPDFSRSNRLLAEAERIYQTFSQHPYDRTLSEDVVDVLVDTIGDEPGYADHLVEFAEQNRGRIERAYEQFGPTSEQFLEHGRYLLVSQPESLIIFERLANALHDLQETWEGTLESRLLTDLARVWGVRW